MLITALLIIAKIWKQCKCPSIANQMKKIRYIETLKHYSVILLLLLLSRFSRVRLCATAQMASHQAPLSLGFSRQEHWSVGCHFLLQHMKVKSKSEVAQSSPTLSDPMDCSPPGSSVHRIFQARVLEWGAIAFSDIKSIKSCHLTQHGWAQRYHAK